MNKQRRAQLNRINCKMELLRGRLEELIEEEQCYFDNMPESFADGEKGEKAQEAIDNMESARYSLDEAAEYITSAIEG